MVKSNVNKFRWVNKSTYEALVSKEYPELFGTRVSFDRWWENVNRRHRMTLKDMRKKFPVPKKKKRSLIDVLLLGGR